MEHYWLHVTGERGNEGMHLRRSDPARSSNSHALQSSRVHEVVDLRLTDPHNFRNLHSVEEHRYI